MSNILQDPNRWRSKMARVRKFISRKYDLTDLNSPVIDESRKSKIMYTVMHDNGELWYEAHLYLIHRSHLNSKTILSNAKDLAAYLSFLEQEGINWLHFPKRKADRCLYRFREYLLDTSKLSQTKLTEQRRINLVVKFYRWAEHERLIDSRIQKWEEKNVSVAFYDATGFSRSLSVQSTDLRISARKSNTYTVEGLTPLHPKDRDTLMEYLKKSPSESDQLLRQMFSLGFWSGARSQTIRTIGLRHIQLAKDAHPIDKNTPSLVYMAAGGNTGIKTKFDVQGYLRIPLPVFEQIYTYAHSEDTYLRRFKASHENKDLLFLSNKGRPISDNSLTALISQLRQRLISEGLTQFHRFKFHQTRATCGTELATILLSEGGSEINAIRIVQDWLMHKHESSTWNYIQFVRNNKWTEEFNNLFVSQFLGPSFANDNKGVDNE